MLVYPRVSETKHRAKPCTILISLGMTYDFARGLGQHPSFSKRSIECGCSAILINKLDTPKPLVSHGFPIKQVGVSENSVPLHPMVNDHYPY